MRLSAEKTRASFRIWTIFLIASAILTVLSIAYIDRPLATFFDERFRDTYAWNVLYWSLQPSGAVVVVALFFLFWAGYRSARGYELQPWAVKAVVCCWAVVWGLASEIIFKQIFGRAWPEPTYLRQHIYGFRFLHGTYGWTSFPSGTAIGSSALATTVAILFPRWRILSAACAALACIAVVVVNFHWLSDCIAGAFLGVTIGWMSTNWLNPTVLNKRESIREFAEHVQR